MRGVNQFILKIILLSIIQIQISDAAGSYDPWYTGPLIAESAKVTSLGKRDFWFKTFFTRNSGVFEDSWEFENTAPNKNILFKPTLKYGLADRIEVKYIAPYQIKKNQGASDSDIGDVGCALNYQLFEQTSGGAWPYILLSLQETFPTGRYDNLLPSLSGTDSTGMGSYQTVVGLNLERSSLVSFLTEQYYVSTRINVVYTHPTVVKIKGLSTYGGSTQTQGRIQPGDSLVLDLSTELSLTQHWVAVMEGSFLLQNASRFYGKSQLIKNNISGESTISPNNAQPQGFNYFFPTSQNITPNTIGNGMVNELTLAPAIEYNFAEHMGVIAGAWFILAGKNTPSFLSTSVSFHVIW